MPRFVFTAHDHNGQRRSGSLEAASREAALTQLAQTYPLVTRLDSADRRRIWLWGASVKGEDLLAFTQQLAAVAGAGLSLQVALDTLAEDTESATLRRVVIEVSQSVGEGKTLSGAMAQYPEVFSPYYTSMVQAGEASGTLPVLLTRLAEHLERAEVLTDKVKAAFYYPAVVVGFALVLGVGIVALGVPMLEGLYGSMGTRLPLPTRMLLSLGHLLLGWWPVWLIGSGVAVWTARHLLATPGGRLGFDRLRRALPLVGSLFRLMAVARFARNLGILYQAGIPMLQAMDLLQGSMNSPCMDGAVKQIRNALAQGEPLGKAMRETGLFTAMALGMVGAGEATGHLEQMLGKLADFYDVRVDMQLKAVTSLIEPLLMIVVGVTLGGLILCLGLPFLNLVSGVL